MKKTIFRTLLMAVFITVSHFSAGAYSFSSVCSTGQTLYFDILSDSTVAVVFPNLMGGSYYSGYSMPTGNLHIPSSVTYAGDTYTVTSIGNNAFTGCTGLTGLLIPNTVTSIGSSACSQCTGLVTVDIPNTVTSIGDNAFMGCSHLTSIVLPSTVTLIGVGTFQGCGTLASVTMGPSVTAIGNVAFEGCSSLTSIHIPDEVTMIGNWAFCNCTSLDSIYIGASVLYVLSNTFSGSNNVRYMHYNARNAVCSSGYQSALPVAGLTQLVIGNDVQTLSQYTFANAQMLDSVSIGCGVTSIDGNAFFGTSNVHYLDYNNGHFTDVTFPHAAFSHFSRLTTVVFGDSVQYIPKNAFSQKDSLQQVVYSSSVRSIGDSAFRNCSSLSGPLQLPSMLTAIGNASFEGCSGIQGTLALPSTLTHLGAEAFAGCAGLEGTLNIPATLQLIDMGAFRGCEWLSEVVLSDSLVSLGSSSFSGCVHLTAPTFPNSLTTIGDSVFYGCSMIGGQLSFPASVGSIGDYAFASVDSITGIIMRAVIPPTIFAHTFASVSSSIPIQVPCGVVLNYTSADYWEDFTNITESMPFNLIVSVNDTSMGTFLILQEPTCSDHTAWVQAVADSGYHFVRWSDGTTANPRRIRLVSDTIVMALFASDNSYITVFSNDSARGTVSGSGTYGYNDTAFIVALSSLNYHFLYWNDGDTCNPRSVIVTQDSIFEAFFVSDTSTFIVSSDNLQMGTVSGGGVYLYQDVVTISAFPDYGYHFVQWNDGITVNPRQVLVSQDSAFTAFFSANNYSVLVSSANPIMGTVTGGGIYAYHTTVTILASPSEGAHFVQWSDGNTENPRTVIISSDTVLVAQFAYNMYDLDLSVNDTSLGSVSGGGTYSYNSVVTISAIPNEGCHFVQWNDGSTTNPRTLTVTGDISYIAQFAVNVYSIMVSSASPAMGTVSGGGAYAHNTIFTISAIPATGYHFVQWNDGNSDNPRTLAATHNATYIAQFAVNTYTLNVASAQSALGTVSGGGTYMYNSLVTISAVPNYGYHFVQWDDAGTDNPRTVRIVRDTTYTAQFDTNTYRVTALSSDFSGGSVLGGGTYNYLTLVTLTAQPSPHYHFVQWSDSLPNNPRTITLVCDTQLTAQFQIDSHFVAVSSANPAMGHTSGSTTVAYGNVLYISATPNYGYHFSGWSDGNLQNPRRVVVTSDTSFYAQFVPNNYSAVITSGDSALGAVSGGGIYSYLSSITLMAIPLGNSRFVTWSDGNSDNPRTLLLTKDTNLVAQFVVNTCQLVCQPSDPTMGMVSGSGTYNFQSQVEILATANSHCHFVRWNDGLTDNPRLVTLTSDTLFVAYFMQDTQYSITVTSNDYQMGQATGSGRYYYGDQAMLSAIPYEHYHFVNWSDGSTANPRIVRVIADADYQAVFSPDMFSVTLSVNNPDMGAAYGGGEYPYFAEATFTAVSFPGYAFRSWNDGNTDNPRIQIITENISYQAIFYDELGISDKDQNYSYRVFVKDKCIFVEGVLGEDVSVFDIYGRKIVHFDNVRTTLRIEIISTGVYLIRVGSGDAVKIVIL